MTKIAVIIGSTREGRVSDKLAAWVAKEVGAKAETEVLDLRDYTLPFFDEPMPPRYKRTFCPLSTRHAATSPNMVCSPRSVVPQSP